MPIDKKFALEQIDAVLKRYDEIGRATYPRGGLLGHLFADRNGDEVRDTKELCTRMSALLMRLAPPQSFYSNVPADDPHKLAGNLVAFRSDLEAGYLESVTELIHGETFANFLDMAAHLLKEGYKDAAAVIAGGTLEQHLRALCGKHSIIPIPDKISTLNDALYRKVYQADWMKQIVAWGDLRNNAAHGHYDKVNAGLVESMIAGIRLFMTTFPA